MYQPADPPAQCPACGAPYESVSRHADGFMVNLIENDRYRRVCFYPAPPDSASAFDCFHHTHEQTNASQHSHEQTNASQHPHDHTDASQHPPGRDP